MKIVQRKDIDVKLWDEKIANSSLQNPTMYSKVLDICADHWCAIVTDDYSFMWPLTFSKKLNVKRLRQQSFGRQVDYLGNEQDFLRAIEIAKKEFPIAEIGVSNVSGIETTRRFQKLMLSADLDYSKNTKRILKKNIGIEISEIGKIDEFIQIYETNSFQKFKQSKENPTKLKDLITHLSNEKKCETFGIYNNERLVAGISLIYDKKTCYYLIGDADMESKKQGLMFVLMDYAIRKAQEKGFTYFDFGGSNVNSVANFYHKMGGNDFYYSYLHWNRAPFWYKLAKRFR